MANYLTKEDIKKWRSSLERITLEQYAQKLGKEIPEEKETFDIVDIVLEHNNNHLSDDIDMSYTGEKISVFANLPKSEKITKVVSLEEMKKTKVVEEKRKRGTKFLANASQSHKPEANNKNVEKIKSSSKERKPKNVFDDSILLKPLTSREQVVFDIFRMNAGEIVWAKDLALKLELPRDYVYKYIKTLRSKLKDASMLENSEKGGYIFRV